MAARFREAQVASAGFDLRAELTAAQAVAFLRSLPRTPSSGRAGRGARWVVASGGSLRPTTRPVPGAVCLPGPERLVALRRVLRDATALRVYGPVADGAAAASAWEVVLPGMRLTLTLSPDSARGFSGEGGVLEALATDDAAADAELVSVLLAWEPRIEPAELAGQAGLSVERVRAALVRLGTAGRVGYDLADAAYFHRELPYDADRAERHNPRLVAARRLVGEGACRSTARGPRSPRGTAATGCGRAVRSSAARVSGGRTTGAAGALQARARGPHGPPGRGGRRRGARHGGRRRRAMNELLSAVRDGRHHEVPPLVLALDRPGRRAALAELKELRKEARGWDWRRRDRVRKALLVAGAGCQTGAAACAAWIGGRDLRDWTRSPYPLILAALKDRDPAWLGDLADGSRGVRPSPTRSTCSSAS